MPSVNKAIELLPILGLFLWVLAAVASRTVRYEKTAIRIPLLIFIIIIVLMVARAEYVFSSAHTAATWIVHICVFFLVANLSVRQRRYKVLVAALLTTFAVVIVLSIYQYFVVFDLTREQFNQNQISIVVPDEMRQDLVNRLNLDEAFGTFLLSNVLAGYVILVLPVAVFLAINAFKKGEGKTPASGIIFCIAALGAVVLYLTGSKGGWLGLMAGGAIFLLFYWYSKAPLQLKKKRRNSILFVILVFIVVLITAMALTGFENLPESVKVRLGYWDAALRMILRHPLGAGLSNFQEHYSVHQQIWATEVRSAHNSFLTMLAELSVIGLMSFIIMLYISGRRFLAATGNIEEKCEINGDSEAGDAFHGLMLLSGILGILFMALLGAISDIPFAQPSKVVIGSMVLWALVFYFLLKAGRLLSDRFVTYGMALGMLALLSHMFIDFDFYSHGINATFWIVLGLLLCRCCRMEKRDSVRVRMNPLGMTAGVLIMLVIFVFGVFYLPRALTADLTTRKGREVADEAVKTGYVPLVTLEAIELFEEAHELSPWNSENYRAMAELYDNLFLRTKDIEYALKAVKYYSRLIKIRPLSHSAYYRRGFLKSILAGGDLERIRDGLHDVEKAVELYPGKAGYHYGLGIYLERMAGLLDAEMEKKVLIRARSEYLRALEIHEESRFRRGKLLPKQLDIIKQRLGRP